MGRFNNYLTLKLSFLNQTYHYCHSLTQTGSMLFKTRVPLSYTISFIPVSLLLFENELEIYSNSGNVLKSFLIFFHIGEHFTTATCPFSHMNLFLQALTNSWWSCDIFLLTSSKDAIFQEHVLRTFLQRSNINSNIWI